MRAQLQRRLAKIEAQTAEREHREMLADCNCQERTLIVSFKTRSGVEQFKSLIEVPCPCHGLRRLGEIRNIVFVAPDGTSTANPELDQLIAEYEERILEDDLRREKEEDDAEESRFAL